jgi:hypothetical protein
MMVGFFLSIYILLVIYSFYFSIRDTVTVSNVHGMHTSAGWPNQGLRVLAVMPTVGEIGSADLCGCRFVKGKSAA